MTVITEHSQYRFSSIDQKCDVCGGHLHPPFLEWECAGRALCICAKCCCKIRTGFGADLLQVEAVAALKKDYPDLSLERVSSPDQVRAMANFKKVLEGLRAGKWGADA